jgi:HD-like signal output (HDOD) protein
LRPVLGHGLLHHVGTLLIDLHLRTRFRSMLEQLDIGRPTYHQEREMLSFDQAQLGAHVTRSWNFPETITEAIRYHESPEEYTGEHEKIVHLLSVADYLCSRAGLTALGVFNTAPPSARAYAALGVDRVALVIIWDDLLTHLANATNF